MSFMAGSVFANLVLDDKKFAEGIQKAQRDLGRLGERFKTVGADISKVGKTMSIAGAAIVGGLGLMLKSVADAGDQVAKLSQKTGVAIESLSSYRLAADLAGASLENVGIGMRMLSVKMLDAKRGLKESQDAFAAIGVEALDAEGNLRDLNDVMLDAADAFAAMPDGAEKSALAMRLFGRSGSELIPMLNMGRKGLEENRKEAEKLGMVFTEKTGKDAENFKDALTRLNGAFMGVKNQLAQELMPQLTELIDKFRGTVTRITDWIKEHPKLVAGIVKVVAVLGGLLAVLGPIVFVIGKLTSAIGGLIVGFAKMLPLLISIGPILLVIAAVGAAAFVGWKIGQLIRDLVGLDEQLQNVFDKTFRFLGIIKDTNIELGEAHAERYALQQEAIAQATELAGREVKSFIEAKRILQRQFKETGTTGNEALDGWLGRLPPIVEKVHELTEVVDEAAQVVAEAYRLARMESMKLKDATVDGKQGFEDMKEAALELMTLPIDVDVDSMLEALFPKEDRIEVPIFLQSIVDETIAAGQAAARLAAVMTKTDIQKQIEINERTLVAFGSSMPESEVRRLTEEIKRLKAELADTTPWERFLAGAVDAFNQIQSQITPVIAQFQRNKEIAIENEYKKRLDFINKTIGDEEKKQKAIQALEAEFEIKKTSARRAAARTEKAVALVGAIVNTAQAITKSLAQGGFILGIPWAAIIGAMGAAQVAAIAAQPIPLAEGAAFEQPTLLANALVGEKGPEYLLPEKKLQDIVRDAFVAPRYEGAPALAVAGAGGPTLNLTMNGPFIATTGLTRQEIWEAGEEFIEVIKYQLERIGGRLHG